MAAQRPSDPSPNPSPDGDQGRSSTAPQAATKQSAKHKAVTPPKGRPTRSRDATGRRPRAFGPVLQWITVVVLLLLIFVALVMVTDGGDFNPFDDSAPAVAPVTTDAR